ncbi:methyl-accepting chemotaxis protein [Clostridium tyrobutyricum]|uniref:methyl-accepting chemotaxis protein n=1 Tax=Clostridium tyrobutyricum TaxID=1519 RepID=UPI001C381792|nr:methyl-accepting chemotaxis protein [Clostridium tyrobutyricum]MBV4418705.1 methyl-accepting chemotaxis protein [Clostridium tyrobutyricum]
MEKISNFKFIYIFTKIKQSIKIKDLSFLHSVSIKIIAKISILVILICGIIGLISYYSSYRVMEQNINSSLQHEASESSKLINAVLQQHVKSMLEIADRTEIKSMNPKIQLPVLAERSGELNYASLSVMDLKGLAYMQTGAKTKIDLDNNDSKYLKTALEGKVKIAGPYFNVNGDQIIAISVPIKINNKVIGVLFCNISTNELNKLVQNMKIGESGYCFIIDKYGSKVAHKNLTLVLNRDNTIKNARQDKSLTQLANLEKSMILGKKGSGYYEQNGKEMFLAYSPISNINWYLGITMDKNEIFNSVYTLKYKIIAATIIFILIGIFIGIIIANQVKKPLVKIRKYAQALSNFNLEYKMDINSKDEFGQTVDSLNSALLNIKNMIKYVKKESCITLDSTEHVNQMFMESDLKIKTVSNKSEEITSNIQATLSSIEEVRSRIILVKEKSENTVNQVNKGLKLADDVNKKAIDIRNNIEQSKENIQKYYTTSTERLKKSLKTIKVVNNISKMLNEIKSISKKTNILALNASIEAAKAGEYGRGFMAVAEQVKVLGKRSSDMTNNIESDIKDIMIAVGDLVDSSQNVLNVIEKNVMTDYIKIIKISEEYQNDGMKIKSYIKNFYVLTDDINSSQQQISNVINSITDSVGKCTDAAINILDNMNSIEQKNADISLDTVENANNAKKLIDIVDQFKVKN